MPSKYINLWLSSRWCPVCHYFPLCSFVDYWMRSIFPLRSFVDGTKIPGRRARSTLKLVLVAIENNNRHILKILKWVSDHLFFMVQCYCNNSALSQSKIALTWLGQVTLPEKNIKYHRRGWLAESMSTTTTLWYTCI